MFNVFYNLRAPLLGNRRNENHFGVNACSLAIVRRDPDNRLRTKRTERDSAGWSAHWESLGGLMTSTPAISSLGTNLLDVYAKGGDNSIVSRAWDGTNWSEHWGPLGGIMTSGPAAVSFLTEPDGVKHRDVFAKGVDNTIQWITL
jgi:hypothetical protein